MNALLDYGSSSSSDTDEEEVGERSPNDQMKPKLPKPTLPKPTLGENSLNNSVFSNPFVEAELAKAAILEKHVKMVPGKGETQMINGKKICWNYRKGRCRFGHNCKYAHDSDLHKTADELEADKQEYNTVFCESSSAITGQPPPDQDPGSTKLPTDDELWEGGPDRKRRRPGLSKGLVPGKKVLQMYREQRKRDFKK